MKAFSFASMRLSVGEIMPRLRIEPLTHKLQIWYCPLQWADWVANFVRAILNFIVLTLQYLDIYIPGFRWQLYAAKKNNNNKHCRYKLIYYSTLFSHNTAIYKMPQISFLYRDNKCVSASATVDKTRDHVTAINHWCKKNIFLHGKQALFLTESH